MGSRHPNPRLAKIHRTYSVEEMTRLLHVHKNTVVTGYNEIFARDEIKKSLSAGKFGEIRDQFLRYILKIDSGRITIPSSELYAQLKMARAQIERLTSQGARYSSLKRQPVSAT